MNWSKWHFGCDGRVCMLGVPLVSPPNSWPIAADTWLKPQQLGADAHQWGMQELCGYQTDLFLWKQWISPCFREVGGELSPPGLVLALRLDWLLHNNCRAAAHEGIIYQSVITIRERSTWLQSAPIAGFPGSQPSMALKSKEFNLGCS